MGRITVFTADGCADSECTKALLDGHEIPYTEINVTTYPVRRADLLALSGGNLSTPQVFFNSVRVGGFSKAFRLFGGWEQSDDRIGITPLQRFEFEVARQPVPVNPRLAEPPEGGAASGRKGGGSASSEPPSYSAPQKRELLLPNGNEASFVEVIETLKQILPLRDNVYNITAYKNSFLGEQAVQVFMGHYGIGEEKAVNFGRYLQENRILDHVVSKHDFCCSGYFFRLNCHQTPDVLNSYRTWMVEEEKAKAADDAVSDLMRRLFELMSQITTMVEVKVSNEHPLFPAFEEAICELQVIRPEEMDDETKTAFAVNVYNLMIRYAIIKFGFPSESGQRQSFFTKIKFNVGGHLYTLSEWKHGVLRGNRARSGLAARPPFGPNDERAKLLAVQSPDPRVHFCVHLGCDNSDGAASVPPALLMSAEHLEVEMKISAASFCERDDRVAVDPVNMHVQLAKVFDSYRSDFCRSDNSNENLLAWILPYLRGEKRKSLQSMMSDGASSIRVTFFSRQDYWSNNNANNRNVVPFSSSALYPNKTVNPVRHIVASSGEPF